MNTKELIAVFSFFSTSIIFFPALFSAGENKNHALLRHV